jgi:hypothetical protein
MCSKTAPAGFRFLHAEGCVVFLKNFGWLLAVILGLLFVSGIFGPGVYASETILADPSANWQFTCAMPTVFNRLPAQPVTFKPEQYEYQYGARWVADASFSAEFVEFTEKVATPTPTTQGQNTSDKSYLLYILVGGLVVLMALFIVVVVKVLKKLKDLSNGR